MKLCKSSKKRVVNPRFAKSAEYRDVIKKIQAEGKCPFCPENFKYHKYRIFDEQGGWFITRCSWPYKNARYHFLIISKRHKECAFGPTGNLLMPLISYDWVHIKSLLNWVLEKFRIKGGALTFRFGDTNLTGATVCHLHFHLIVPKRGETVNFPIG